MHAVARLHYATLIDNIQVSWVKMGVEGSRRILQAGANDLGGTLMDENISRAAGATHGQEMDVENLRALVAPLGRPPAPTKHPLPDHLAMPDPIEAFLSELDDQTHQSPERRAILRGLVTRIVELAQLEADTADLRIASTALNELLEASTLFAAWRDKAKVTVFGSARTKADDPLYEMARAFGEATAARGWMTVSGAGPGIMEASAKGSGKDNTLGVNIELPFEQGANEFIDVDEMHVAMKFFFTRKVAMTRASHAFVAFPGGVGTMDELFEILTLVHTGKTTRPRSCSSRRPTAPSGSAGATSSLCWSRTVTSTSWILVCSRFAPR